MHAQLDISKQEKYPNVVKYIEANYRIVNSHSNLISMPKFVAIIPKQTISVNALRTYYEPHKSLRVNAEIYLLSPINFGEVNNNLI